MRIGLTGGVGCGVSEVARRLESKGIAIVSGDQCGHLTLKVPEVRESLRQQFGATIFQSDGEIDRKSLGSIIFADPAARIELNRIVQPCLLDLLKSKALYYENTGGIPVVDAALIYEWGIGSFFYRIIAVSAPLDLRIARAMRRDNLTKEQVLQRMAAQMPIEQKIRAAHIVIENNASIAELYEKTDEVLEKIRHLS
ncbi:MAG: dephospho-CoA kinase [bacterium]|nr:dephospho-CoA kinase [bacterium]